MRVKTLTLTGAAAAVFCVGTAAPALAAAPEGGSPIRATACWGTVSQGSTSYGKVVILHRHGKMVGRLTVTKTAKPGKYGIMGKCKRITLVHPIVVHPTVVFRQTTMVPTGAAKTGFGGSQESSSVPLTVAGLTLLLAGGTGLGLLARRRVRSRARS